MIGSSGSSKVALRLSRGAASPYNNNRIGGGSRASRHLRLALILSR